jgi:polyhydroxyalkanoate synthesis regulator phasin
MRDIIMDSFKLGLGAIELTREQAERLVARLDAMYPDEIKDGRRMIEELFEESQKNAEKVRQRIEAEVSRAIKAQKLVPEENLKELAANVRELARQTQKIAVHVSKVAVRQAKQHVAKKVPKRTAPKKTKKAPKTAAKRSKKARRTGKAKRRR